MKKLILVLVCVILFTQILEAQGQYQYRKIRDLQFKPVDSLLVADQLQNTQPIRWTLQSTSFLGDTVRIVGVCIIPPKVMMYTSFGYNFVLADTGYTGPFGHIFIRPDISSGTNPGDTILYQGILNIERGDIVEVVGRMWEFPGPGESGYPTMNTMSQIVPPKNPSFTNFNIIGSAEVPPPYKLLTSDFYEGIFPGGKIKFSTGEPYESAFVELTNLTVVSWLNTTNGTVNLIDDFGNMISTYDASKWWTLRGHRAPNSPYTAIFPINTRIDTIRGWLTTVSGSENPRGYRIAPIDTTDVIRGIARPSVYSVRRYPVIVTTDSLVKIEAIIRQGAGGKPIANRSLNYSVDNGAYNTVTMQPLSGDTLYQGQIPIHPVGTFVKYFIKVTDIDGNFTISANGAGGGLGSDTSKGFYFYKITTGNLTIQDVQYTPYTNGRSPYVGAVTTLRGVITADTSDIRITARSSGGTSSWYLQAGNNAASGIWITGILDTLKKLVNGDSVAITGTIQENYDVTRLGNVSAVQWFSSGNSSPVPVKLTTGIFGPGAGNGDLNAEPWEGMLVEFDTVTVTDIWPTYSDPTEYSVSDGTGSVLVGRDGMNTFSNIAGDSIYPGITVIKVGDKFSKLRGIIYYSYNRYKICPRKNTDFGNYIPVSVNDQINAAIPSEYLLSDNYPNPFNPKTNIEYAIPKEGLVTLKIYNIIGQEVAILKNEVQKPGTYKVGFDASKLASGVYFYHLNSGKFNQVKKMMLIK